MKFTDLTARKQFANPFPHFQCQRAVSEDSERKLIDWLEHQAPWKLKIADFYEQYEFSLFDCELPTELAFLTDTEAVSEIREALEESFDAKLSLHYDATVHKLVPGQVIKVHNDYIPGLETHRLLIQLNTEWTAENGGLLLLFSGPTPDDLVKALLPQSASAFGFEISPASHHAVTPVVSGHRFTIVYSFYPPEKDEPSSIDALAAVAH